MTTARPLSPARRLTGALLGTTTAAVVGLSLVAAPAATAAAGDGPDTTTGQRLEAYQARHDLPATGRTDAATARSLRSASRAELARIYPAAQASATLSGQECTNARTVIGVGKGKGIPRRGIEIALMTAMQESKFVNYTTAVDHDSLGIFQQRPSTGWGTPAQITNVVTSTQSFYGVAAYGSNAGLLQIPSWQTRDRGEVAQAVQVSAYPDRYDQWTDWAVSFYDQQAGSTAAITGDSGSASPCAGGGSGAGKYYVDTYADAPVYASPTSTAQTGTLYGGTSYVYCKAYGRQVGSGGSYNHYWLRTDPDQGPGGQYVSAYYLSRWGNDEAKDNNGAVIPDC
ncbi:hypothetical protein GCM10011519_08600 [Marmoricola endophyticus]|uniref:Peptidoglycan-binding protein n=1 Tax=Marmoricola endophyticus TaxID=2040280 RepID=A0A917BDR1_9ACTN|nr:hypothetical protein [Marmoricola endophyticus]GGF37358.1 hypothetical protein GCM10011519_08600 [Marmoricola endophyticus]